MVEPKAIPLDQVKHGSRPGRDARDRSIKFVATLRGANHITFDPVVSLRSTTGYLLTAPLGQRRELIKFVLATIKKPPADQLRRL